jgi:uncharacterized protein YkwD
VTLAVVLAISAATAAAVPTLAATPTTLSAHSARHHHHHHKAKTQTPAATPAAPPTPAPPTVLSCADTDLVPTSQNLDRIVAATLCLVNDQRAVAGLGSLHAAMTSAATAHSLDMVAANYVAQADPSGRGPLERLTTTGYVRPNAAVDIAENVASQVGTASTPYQTVSSWMSSPGSRAVILTARYTDTGIGVTAAPAAVAGSGPGATYTEDFGATS